MTLNHVHNYCLTFLILLYAMIGKADATRYNHEEKKIFSKEFSADESSKVFLTHQDGAIYIKESLNNTARIEVELIVRGDVKKDLQTIIQKYELDVEQNNNVITLNSNSNIKSRYQITTGWIFTKTKSGVTFHDGTEINSKVTDIISKATLYLPAIRLLHLENKHHDIRGENLNCDVEVVLYDSHLELGNIEGDFVLDLKHGSAQLGNFKNGNIQLFDSKAFAGNGETILLDAKHSELTMQDLNSVDMTVFDSEIEFDHVADRMDMEEKHSRVSVISIGSGEWENFDSKIKIGEAKSLEIKSKHGTFEIKQAGSMRLDVFDSQLELGTIESIRGSDFKHSRLNINELESVLDVKNLIDTNIDIETIQNDFQSIYYEGESSDLRIGFEQEAEYTIDVDLKHGIVRYPEEDMNVKKYIEKDSRLEIIATKGNAAIAPVIKVEGRSVNLFIN